MPLCGVSHDKTGAMGLFRCSTYSSFDYWETFQLAPALPDMPPSMWQVVLLEHCLIFWPYMRLQAHPVHFLPWSPRNLGSVFRRMVLENRSGHYELLMAPGMLFLLGPLSCQSKKCVYINLCLYTHLYLFLYANTHTCIKLNRSSY